MNSPAESVLGEVRNGREMRYELSRIPHTAPVI
jgi:hypothetical protein